ncbi:MAG: hypothetical protein J6V11_02580, partial [Alphaproteobacteria bacterium]|nr:hypothetical protein [Alphaproteobacteria bacterium]
NMMQLKVHTPIGTVLDLPVKKVDLEGLDGFRTLLPRHADFINALAAGIVSYTTEDDKTLYVACNRGVVVKKDKEVRISTPLAILDDNLEKLMRTIEIDFKQMEEERKEVNTTMARLEIGLIKGMKALKAEGGISGGL